MAVRKICFFLSFLTTILLSGCSQLHTTEEAARVAVQIDVTCTRDGESVTRQYTTPEKLEAMLLYLRLLKPKERAQIDPEDYLGTVSKISVLLSSGEKRIYRIRADKFLSKDAAPWQVIDPAHAQQLYPLLLLMPSDPI